MEKYDAIIIGAGQAGIPLAKKLAKAGWKTAIIEKRLIGGTCINDGCTPTKTMIASARIAYLVKNSNKWGITTDSYTVDMPAIVKRKDDIVITSREGSEKNLQETKGLEVIFGEATFTGIKTLSVTLKQGDRRFLNADKLFIDTGAQPLIPPIQGIQDINYLTSTTILNLTEVPEHILIVGSGYIALEFGQMYKRLGSKVTIVEKGEKFLSGEDEDVAETMKNILEEEGIRIYTKTQVSQVQQLNPTQINATLSINNLTEEISCSHLLVATGRSPQIGSLNLDKTGVETDDKGYIQVNDRLETTTEGIFALGDVKGGPAFTHVSYNDYIIVWKNLLEGADLSIKNRLLPYCLFTDPQLGRLGLSEQEALQKGYQIKIAKLPMEHVARARETGETLGFMKAIVDIPSKRILGAAIIGTQGGEIMSVLQVAMMGGITYEQLRYAMFAHPTFSESLNNLFMKIEE
ncbi:mercuric reductase [Rhodocytophaga rosea]|uniref:Mercuric reductase n=1 Tax=Rhodocytophaga rosea TaxID=2704465 RepID=A0A6C0GSU5_9BACT|nr:mercuric reductase [Rhodocytophaga rosea]QHT71096.1 mercuric reductase [Rhodocytophaga rosea]